MCNAEVADMIDSLVTESSKMVNGLRQVDLIEGGLHISLSRTLFLKDFEVENVVDSLRERMKGVKRSVLFYFGVFFFVS